MRSLRIIVLMHEDLIPPETMEGYSEKDIASWKTEFDVVATLKHLGHEVKCVGVRSNLDVIREAIETFKPHVAFNVLEEFHGVSVYDQAVVSFLELLRQPYTGCNPRGLMLAHDKALSKKILAYHRLPVPKFAVFPVGKKFVKSKRLEYPVLVKSLTEEASAGISHASIVTSDDKLAERVEFIHRTLGTDAIAEQYIEGRELYVGIMGNQRLRSFPLWELTFDNLPEDSPNIATAKVKWDVKYQRKVGLSTGMVTDLEPALMSRIAKVCKRAYHLLNLTGYARMDLRLSHDNIPYLIEANPNPNLSYGEDFAESAHHCGIEYDDLIQRILNLGMRYRAAWRLTA
ncbi:MAG: ATP-grasp domain-containing protein [Phycisphaeraceae bacterium]